MSDLVQAVRLEIRSRFSVISEGAKSYPKAPAGSDWKTIRGAKVLVDGSGSPIGDGAAARRIRAYKSSKSPKPRGPKVGGTKSIPWGASDLTTRNLDELSNRAVKDLWSSVVFTSASGSAGSVQGSDYSAEDIRTIRSRFGAELDAREVPKVIELTNKKAAKRYPDDVTIMVKGKHVKGPKPSDKVVATAKSAKAAAKAQKAAKDKAKAEKQTRSASRRQKIDAKAQKLKESLGEGERFEDKATWKKSLTSDERGSLRSWDGSAYTAVRQLQSGKIKPGDNPKADKVLANLDSAFAQAPLHSGTVHRGLHSLTQSQIAAFTTKGAVIETRGYSSWATSTTEAGRFAYQETKGSGGNLMLRVSTSRSVNVTGQTGLPTETEVIAPKGKYRVASVSVFQHPVEGPVPMAILEEI